MAKQHHLTVEKIGGTSMSRYDSVRDNIIRRSGRSKPPYHRILVVSAYAGITDRLLEHKKSGQPGIYALFANGRQDDSWQDALRQLDIEMQQINAELFADDSTLCDAANAFMSNRLTRARHCLEDLENLCRHGHFSLADHLATVREMLASLGESHSAWNMAERLKNDGINARFVDLTGWQDDAEQNLDERIKSAFDDIDLANELPITTGYAHTQEGLMSTFDRGYSEMTFSRIAVMFEADEAIIHKEFHLSSADPRVVGTDKAVPIGRTNYDVADQLANLGMEAIHPKAAKGLRQHDIPLRIKNTFEPEHTGTLITRDYVSEKPCAEIIAGTQGLYALEVYDQNMSGNHIHYDLEILKQLARFNIPVIAKDTNANTITHYISASLKIIKRVRRALEEHFDEAIIDQQQVAMVCAIGSDLRVPGILAKTTQCLANHQIQIKAVHQSPREVDIQFIIHQNDYHKATQSLHQCLVEIHDHGRAICLAS
ncbi:aspartate kinase [Celerinatantimonas yamalensis]|uniref:aspartate kinase n=1 Tax=Celerinatantimonas yamalensis TaxID=559956 RepID=A0ABW9G3Y8_9GAMM